MEPTTPVVLLRRAGHLSNLEAPGPFNEAVLSFLTRLDAGQL